MDNTIYRQGGRSVFIDERDNIYVTNENNLSVVMLARQDDSFIFIRQFRKPANKVAIQLPGGGVEEGEDLEDAARRELLEETGYECGEIHYLGELIPASWISNEITHVYYTDDIRSRDQQNLENYESIEVVTVPVNETMELIKESKINDPELTFAILQAFLKGYVNVSYNR